MQTLTDLTALAGKFAAGIPNLNLDGDELEEYSTVLLRLQNQVNADFVRTDDSPMSAAYDRTHQHVIVSNPVAGTFSARRVRYAIEISVV